MTRMLMVTDVQDVIKKHQSQIITSLKDPDIRLVFFTISVSAGMACEPKSLSFDALIRDQYSWIQSCYGHSSDLKLRNLDCIYQTSNLILNLCNVVLVKHVLLICFLLRNDFGICTCGGNSWLVGL